MIAALVLAATVQFDHLWIVVSRDAPERVALEKAGFRVGPAVSKHEGQGTASVAAEFQNSYLELIWPDPTVPISPGLERGAEKFRQRMLWRTSGWCPIGIVMHRVSNDPLPFPTWSISPAWMEPGTAMEMLMPRDDTKSFALVEKEGVVQLESGEAWAVEVTFDKGAKRKQKDFRPELPLLIRY